MYCGYRGNFGQTPVFGSEWLFGCPVSLHVYMYYQQCVILAFSISPDSRFCISACQTPTLFPFLSLLTISLTTSTYNPHHSSEFQGPHIPSRPIRVVPCSASAPSNLTWATIIGLTSGPALKSSTCQPRQHFSPEVLVTDISAGAFGNGWAPHLLTSYTTRKTGPTLSRIGGPHQPPRSRQPASGIVRNHLVLDVLVFLASVGNKACAFPIQSTAPSRIHYPHRTPHPALGAIKSTPSFTVPPVFPESMWMSAIYLAALSLV